MKLGLTATFAILFLGCATEKQDVLPPPVVWNAHADMELRIHDNVRLSKVLGLDSILCKAAIGAEGKVYFDEVLWRTLKPTQKPTLVQCLDLERKLKVTLYDSSQGRARLWTARISDDQKRLQLGTVWSDCIDCSLKEAQVEYLLTLKGDTLVPHPMSEFEMWR